MVRTRRSIEEEERVRILPHKKPPFYFKMDEFFSFFEGDVIEELLKWGAKENKRALCVGLDDNGRIPLELLKKGMFVVTVDDNSEKINALKEKAKEKKLDLKLNTYETDYMKKDFLTGGFDIIILFGILNRYNEPSIVIKKAKREVKTGGKVFFRIEGFPLSATGVFDLFTKIKSSLKLEKLKNLGIVKALFRPIEDNVNLSSFLFVVEKELKVERIIYDHLLGKYFLKISLKAPSIFSEKRIKDILFLIRKAEKSLFSKPYIGYLSSTIYAFTVKELELGKTFTIEK